MQSLQFLQSVKFGESVRPYSRSKSCSGNRWILQSSRSIAVECISGSKNKRRMQYTCRPLVVVL